MLQNTNVVAADEMNDCQAQINIDAVTPTQMVDRGKCQIRQNKNASSDGEFGSARAAGAGHWSQLIFRLQRTFSRQLHLQVRASEAGSCNSGGLMLTKARACSSCTRERHVCTFYPLIKNFDPLSTFICSVAVLVNESLQYLISKNGQ